MASKYYDSSGKEVSDGDIALASDLNTINSAIDAALQLVETDVTSLVQDGEYWAGVAEGFANSADADATQTAADRVQTGNDVISTASNASTATTAANTATAQAGISTTQAGIATTKASEAAVSETNAATSADEAAASLVSMNKDGSNGVPGLTLLKINFMNALGTVKSFFTNSNTSARTYTFQNRNGTIADDTDLALKADVTTVNLKANIASPTFTGEPKCPTPSAADNSTKIVNSAYVRAVTASSLNLNGYQILPTGVIIQWGRLQSPVSAGTPITVTFPIAFTTTFLAGQATTYHGATGGTVAAAWISLPTTTNMEVRSSVGSSYFFWLAIGY